MIREDSYQTAARVKKYFHRRAHNGPQHGLIGLEVKYEQRPLLWVDWRGCAVNAMKAAQKAREKGGLAMFLCPSRPGELRLTPAACADSYRLSQNAQDVAKVRLWHCMDCEIGAANAAVMGVAPAGKRVRTASYQRGGEAGHKVLPAGQVKMLEFVRVKGRCTAPDAAKHFGRHRDTMAGRLIALERLGLVRRIAGASRTLIWEAAT